ncbi:MAG: response regulator, partial [bacterium]
MENPLILVADADTKNLQILRDSLESSGFSVISANDGILAWEKIQSQHPDLILSEVNLPNYDGFQLLEKLKEDPITSIIPVMFLTNRREIQDRVRSLRGGVKDYMIKPLHVKEVIARIRMILRRIERVKSDDSDSSKKMAGRLEEYSVIELIDNFGAERKTGVLQIYNEHNRNGEIWFKYGAVVHASFGTLKAEKAVYQMLPWQRGHFIMTFKEVQVPETINISNLGLLLHGYKRMEQREQLFKQLPSPETTFVLTEAFRKVVFRKELSQEASKFIALIDGRRDIMQIIDESVYDDIHTLERLVKLHKEGLIRHGAPSDQTSTEINIAAPTLNDVKEELTNSSEHLDYDEVHEDENNIVPTLHEQESVTPSETNDYHTDNDFPPPDYDALDNDNEDEVENPLQNDIKQPELPEKVFSKELENESTTPENKEFTALENRDDHIARHPATSQPIDLQDNVHSNQIVGEHEENTFDSEFTEQDKYHPPVGVPEPLKYSELSPNIDIPNALSEQKSTQQPEPNIHSDHELEPRAIFPEQPISEEGKPEENDTDEYTEHQISDPVP